MTFNEEYRIQLIAELGHLPKSATNLAAPHTYAHELPAIIQVSAYFSRVC